MLVIIPVMPLIAVFQLLYKPLADTKSCAQVKILKTKKKTEKDKLHSVFPVSLNKSIVCEPVTHQGLSSR